MTSVTVEFETVGSGNNSPSWCAEPEQTLCVSAQGITVDLAISDEAIVRYLHLI